MQSCEDAHAAEAAPRRAAGALPCARGCVRVRGVADPEKLQFARGQRREPTHAENLLWERLRAGALGARFRRQHPIGDFVLDFYCAQAKLAVEIDGPSHQAAAIYDAWRDNQLRVLGIETLRISDDDVRRDPVAVLATIRQALAARLRSLAAEVGSVDRPIER